MKEISFLFLKPSWLYRMVTHQGPRVQGVHWNCQFWHINFASWRNKVLFIESYRLLALWPVGWTRWSEFLKKALLTDSICPLGAKKNGLKENSAIWRQAVIAQLVECYKIQILIYTSLKILQPCSPNNVIFKYLGGKIVNATLFYTMWCLKEFFQTFCFSFIYHACTINHRGFKTKIFILALKRANKTLI